MNNIDLSFIRGDTFQTTIKINWDKKITNIYFTLKENEDDKEFKLQKKLGDGITKINEEDGSSSFLLTIDATDTDNFNANYSYFYDIEVISEKIKKTPIKGTLTLTTDITRSFNEV